MFHADRWTDGHEANSRFSQFCERAKKKNQYKCSDVLLYGKYLSANVNSLAEQPPLIVPPCLIIQILAATLHIKFHKIH